MANGEQIGRAFRHAARRVVRERGFSAAAALMLALGIGATTIVFSVVNAVLLRPLPYPQSDRLVSLSHSLVVGTTFNVEQSDATILFYARHNRAFTHIGGYQLAAAALGPVGRSDAERVPAGRVTADLFSVLQVSPLRGRLFTTADDRPGAAPVVVIGERLWARKYGRDPGILNASVEIDGAPHRVVGILPAAVRFPAPDSEIWLPMRLDPARTDSATLDYQAIARLRDGVSIEAATADLARLLPELPDEFPGRMTRASIELTRMRPVVRSLAAVVVGDIGRALWVVLAAAAFVLTIACANVANLFLVRLESRREALAVQRALGAGTGAMFLELFLEGSLVAAIGGLLGVGAAWAGVQMLTSLERVVVIPRLAELGVDVRVLAVAALSTALAAILVSALPALRSSGVSTLPGLGGTSRATTGRERQRVRQALVASQVALALMLVVGSGLLARSVWRLRAVVPGFEPRNAISFRLALPSAKYPGVEESVRFFARAEETLTAIPGVIGAGLVSKLPLDEQGRTDSAVFVEDRPLQPGQLPGIHQVSYITPGYFAAMGIPLVAGRTFERQDPARILHEVVVSRAFAERYWKGQPAVGKRVRIFVRGPLYAIVGVAGAVRDTALDKPEDQTIYCPILPAREDPRWSPRDLAVVIRTSGGPLGVAGAVRDAVRGLDESLPLYRVRLLTDIVAQASARASLTFVVIASASGLALLLGAIGLYGVLSYAVSLRTRELGIRLALGAQPSEIRRMVSRQGVGVAALGIAIGLAGATALTRFLTALLFEVSPTDPLVLGLASAFLLLVAAAASWLPARRAAAVDPALALRAE